MPRNYKCRKCGVEHQPPTGKNCRQGAQGETEDAGNGTAQIMNAIRTLSDRMGGMEQEIAQLKENRGGSAESSVVDREEGHSDSEESQGATAANNATDDMEPNSLRQDLRLMVRAARRLAAIDSDEAEEDESDDLPRVRSQGRKSGSAMVKTDVIRKRIDWPHMNVTRLSDGKRRNVTYEELKLDEFVLGYLTMLQNPRNGMDTDLMIGVLRMVVQDEIEFSWANARAFYQMVGIDVEKGHMKWEDSDKIRDMRLTYSRQAYPQKKEQKETAQSKAAPAGMKCCAPFQTRSCEHARDHQPFTHACSYCHKNSTTLARHSENECFKKMAAEAKNGKKREQ